MKKLLFALLLPVALLVGCTSTTSEDEPETTIEYAAALGGFFTDPNDYDRVVTSLTIGEKYNLRLSPYGSVNNPWNNDGFVTSVSYLLDGVVIGSSDAYPFTVEYTPDVVPGTYTLTVSPVFDSYNPFKGGVQSSTVTIVSE